jgi:uncharacterized protein
VTQDLKRSAELYQRAADLGSVDAMMNLSWCFETGNGVTKDLQESYRLAMCAAMRKHPPGMLLVAKKLMNGVGVKQDVPYGLEWLQKAADAGEPTAQAMVKVAKEKGMIK